MDLTTRQLLFTFTCIPIRFSFAYIAYVISPSFLPLVGIGATAIGLSMMYLYFTNGRLNAPEGGGDTWWKNLRPLHGTIFLCAAVFAFNHNKYTFVPLLIDPIVGLIAFIHKHRLLF